MQAADGIMMRQQAPTPAQADLHCLMRSQWHSFHCLAHPLLSIAAVPLPEGATVCDCQKHVPGQRALDSNLLQEAQ
jgi:hypothetical protein